MRTFAPYGRRRRAQPRAVLPPREDMWPDQSHREATAAAEIKKRLGDQPQNTQRKKNTITKPEMLQIIKPMTEGLGINCVSSSVSIMVTPYCFVAISIKFLLKAIACLHGSSRVPAAPATRKQAQVPRCSGAPKGGCSPCSLFAEDGKKLRVAPLPPRPRHSKRARRFCHAVRAVTFWNGRDEGRPDRSTPKTPAAGVEQRA